MVLGVDAGAVEPKLNGDVVDDLAPKALVDGVAVDAGGTTLVGGFVGGVPNDEGFAEPTLGAPKLNENAGLSCLFSLIGALAMGVTEGPVPNKGFGTSPELGAEKNGLVVGFDVAVSADGAELAPPKLKENFGAASCDVPAGLVTVISGLLTGAATGGAVDAWPVGGGVMPNENFGALVLAVVVVCGAETLNLNGEGVEPVVAIEPTLDVSIGGGTVGVIEASTDGFEKLNLGTSVADTPDLASSALAVGVLSEFDAAGVANAKGD